MFSGTLVKNSFALILAGLLAACSANITISISGVTSGDTIRLFTDSNCTAQVALGIASSTTINLTASTLTAGSYNFYATASNSDGSSSCSLVTAAYSLDLTAPNAPSGLSLQSPSSSPGEDSTPTITVSGVVSGDTVTLFTDIACLNPVASGTASATSINLTSSALSSSGSYNFYANASDPVGNASGCSAVNVAYDYVIYAYYAYVTHEESNATNYMSAYSVNTTTAVLTPLAGSPYATATNGTIRPHGIAAHPNGKFVVQTHFSSTNQIFNMWSIDQATGVPSIMAGSPHTAANTSLHTPLFDPSGQFMYMTIAGSSIAGYTINPTTGAIATLAGSPFSTLGTATGGLVNFLSGQYMATGGNTGHVSVLSMNSSTGALAHVAGSPFAAGGSVVRNIIVDSASRFLYATMESGQIYGFTINSADGTLTAIAGSPFASSGTPAGLLIGPSDKYLFVGHITTPALISVYEINQTTGVLTQISGSPFTTGGGPWFMTWDPKNNFMYVLNRGANTISCYTVDNATGNITMVSGFPQAVTNVPRMMSFVRISQ